MKDNGVHRKLSVYVAANQIVVWQGRVCVQVQPIYC